MLRDLGDRLEYLRGLDKRKEEVTSSITEQGAMTPELTAALSKAKTLAEVEDLYRPYKPKRKTRASIAKARGLQPMPPLRWPVPRTSSPRLFLTMLPAAPNCAATTAPSAASPASRPRMRTASTLSITTTPSR